MRAARQPARGRAPLVVATLAALAACTREPVRDRYCDGSPRWTCGDPTRPACDLVHQRCVAADMGLGMNDLGLCVNAGDCPAAQPLCAAGRCRACSGAGDDAACAARDPARPRCLVTSGRCAACASPGRESPPCAAPTPVCGDDGLCRRCVTPDECATGVCLPSGGCAAAGDVAYADNREGTCSGVHAASAADPACEIADALTRKPLVRVAGSHTAYARLTIGGGAVVIVGPGAGVAARGVTARVRGDLDHAAIVVSGVATTVTLDGIEVSGGGTNQDGVVCSEATLGPALTMVRSAISGIGGAALTASRCTVTLDRDVIGPGNASGVVLNDVAYAVTNCFFVGNGPKGAAVSINSGSGASVGGPGFAHDTVAQNLVSTGVAGVACNGAGVTVRASIVTGNLPLDSGGSVGCAFADSAVGTAVDFVSGSAPAYDVHLAGRSANNLACCVDRVGASTVDHDIDGRARPQPAGGAWDVGAHEVP